MKSLKDFLKDKTLSESAVVEATPEELSLTVSANPNAACIMENAVVGDPPTVLVMHRKSIKQLAEGQRVAVYYVDKIDKYVTVPYAEELSFSEETVIEQLAMSAKNNKNIVVEHTDETSSEVTPDMARQMIDLYKKINEANKAKMLDMLEASAKHFQTIAKFSKE